MEKDNLKIEFRAVPYAHEERVLEYRISPNQDLTYYEDVSYLWGLIRFKRKHRYSTEWLRARIFHCGLTSHYYDVNHWMNYMPIWCNKQDTLNWYKRTFGTFGDFEKYIADKERAEYEKYWDMRTRYLEDRKNILY